MANKLVNEESPYLKQHSLNPVNWYPWSDEALELARKENKPIFISIGYSSCHWCQVMAKESFENEEIAKLLNESFVSIMVDKDERPDINRHFQDIFIKMNNKAGGSPLSIFVTPNLIPIYTATYVPSVPNYGIIGFKELLNTIKKSYSKDPSMLMKKGQEVLDALKPKSKIEATKIDNNLVSTATKQIEQLYNSDFGGFGKTPKFPHTYTLDLGINLYKLTFDSQLKEIVVKSLDSMLLGGIYDIVDGGLCRYSTDEQWLVPHFGKSCYDNALFVDTLIKAYEITQNELYKARAFEVANFMIEKMSQDGLFFSASDADTNGIEGEYFVFDYSEAKEAFESAGVELELLELLNITEQGNFDGKNIVRLQDISLYNDSRVQKAIEVLREIRAKRDYPFVDKKVITSWNAMMINSLCLLGKFDSRYLDNAKNSIEALTSKMADGVKIYHSSLIGSTKRIDGFLEDYAWLGKAYLSYYNATLDEIYLAKTTNLINEALKLFYKNGRWLVGNLDFQDFAVNTDASVPSSVAVMVENLLSLKSLNNPIYEKFAFATLQVASYKLMRQPISMPTMTSAALRYLKDDVILKDN